MTSDEDQIERSPTEPRVGPRAASWPGAAHLRRAAYRRGRRKWAGSVAVGAAAAAAIALVVILPHRSRQPPESVAPGLTVAGRAGAGVGLVAKVAAIRSEPNATDEFAVARAEQAFALALLRQSHRAGGNGNVVFSPSSLAVALSMLGNGASGSTRTEIASTLRSSGLSDQQQDAGWSALTADLAAAGSTSGVTLQSANSLWLQRNLPMNPDFMALLSQYFRAGVWQVDFINDLTGAERALNAWVKAQTHGKITSLFKPGDLDVTTRLVLANAVYFKGTWQTAFDAHLTRNQPFHAVGSAPSVPFMANDPEGPKLAATVTSGYEAVQLPYTGGRFAALAIMPKQQTLPAFADGLSAGGLTQIVGSLRPQVVSLSMPRFTLDNYVDLETILGGMGMPTAFSDQADFSSLSPVPLKLQAAVQRAYLRVDEIGTTGAAVTGLGVQATSAPVSVPITLDHPFLFLVRDTRTGAILFSAEVENPA